MATLLTAAASAQDGPTDADGKPIPVYDPDSCKGDALISDESLEGFAKQERNFKAALKESRLTPKMQESLEIGADYYAYILTVPDKRAEATSDVVEVLRYIDLFSTPESREELNALLTERLTEVLTQCEFADRLAAVAFLSQLNETEYDTKTKTLPRPYWKAAYPLLAAMENPKETAAVKITAAQGIGRVFSDARPPPNNDDQIFRRTVGVLRAVLDGQMPAVNAGPHKDMLVVALVEALGRVDAPTTLNLQPIAVETLLRILTDQGQSDFVRAAALHSLSTTPLPLDNRFNLQPIIEAQMQFLAEWLPRYNEDPKFWSNRWVIAYLYLAFKPATPEEVQAGDGWLQMIETPAFRSAGTPVQGAFEVVKPIFQAVVSKRPLDQEKIAEDRVAAVAEWIEKNAKGNAVHPQIGKLEFRPADGAENGAANAAAQAGEATARN